MSVFSRFVGPDFWFVVPDSWSLFEMFDHGSWFWLCSWVQIFGCGSRFLDVVPDLWQWFEMFGHGSWFFVVLIEVSRFRQRFEVDLCRVVVSSARGSVHGSSGSSFNLWGRGFKEFMFVVLKIHGSWFFCSMLVVGSRHFGRSFKVRAPFFGRCGSRSSDSGSRFGCVLVVYIRLGWLLITGSISLYAITW